MSTDFIFSSESVTEGHPDKTGRTIMPWRRASWTRVDGE